VKIKNVSLASYAPVLLLIENARNVESALNTSIPIELVMKQIFYEIHERRLKNWSCCRRDRVSHHFMKTSLWNFGISQLPLLLGEETGMDNISTPRVINEAFFTISSNISEFLTYITWRINLLHIFQWIFLQSEFVLEFGKFKGVRLVSANGSKLTG
jgi:hypothetical protein